MIFKIDRYQKIRPDDLDLLSEIALAVHCHYQQQRWMIVVYWWELITSTISWSHMWLVASVYQVLVVFHLQNKINKQFFFVSSEVCYRIVVVGVFFCVCVFHHFFPYSSLVFFFFIKFSLTLRIE